MSPPIERVDPSETDDHTPQTSAPVNDLSPSGFRERVGRYRIVHLLGRGGMGSVYLAHDTQLDRNVALKIPHFSADQSSLMDRFFREARAAGRLQHPNICPVYDVGESDGVHYLSMAFIDGHTLTHTVKEYSKRPPRDSALVLKTLALALDEAHRQGVIHRDIKPSNIMLNRRGEPIVMDFGLAREVNTPAANLTHLGVVMGTPAYMSPEQARGEAAAVGPGCDIYSLGVVLYEMLTGRVPFAGQTMEILAGHMRDEPPPLSSIRPDLDPHIEAICKKAMAKEPSRRFLSMADFAQALEEYARGATPAAPSGLLTEIDPLESIAAEALVLMRTWGWEAGVGRLKASLGKGGLSQDKPDTWLLFDWLRGDEAIPPDITARFRQLRQYSALTGWVLLGRGWQANRYHNFERADLILREAVETADPRDNILQAAIAHQRGFWFYQAGRLAEALAQLRAALGMCGHDHFLTADVLGTMALVYANKNNFQTAHELIQQALLAHRRFDNDRVVARCLRHQGELYLDWGYLEKAEEVFQRGLERGLKRQDGHIQGVMFHYLGRVTLAKGQAALLAGKKAQAQQEFARSRQWLDASISAHQQSANANAEAAAHRDRALLGVAESDHDGARTHATRAEELFSQGGHEEGLARVRQVRGMLTRLQGDRPLAERLLRQALAHFDQIADYLEGTRTQLEIARTLADGKSIPQIVSAAYLDALNRAEGCRRPALVRLIEEELQTIDREAHWRHVFGRTRGRSSPGDTCSLADGSSEVASVLFLNLSQFMPFCQGMEPEEVMQTLNHMMADLGEVLERVDGQVTAYLGGGFMALVRGPGHAWRAVDAALDLLAVVEEFNRPREILGLVTLPARVAVASGSVSLGNIGTYRKMDFTAVGTAVNLASRLVRQTSGHPCVSRETREMLGERFSYAPSSPRSLELVGLGRREVWDVTGRRKGLMSYAKG